MLIVLAYFLAEVLLLGFCVDKEFCKKVFSGDMRTLYLFFVVWGAIAAVKRTWLLLLLPVFVAEPTALNPVEV